MVSTFLCVLRIVDDSRSENDSAYASNFLEHIFLCEGFIAYAREEECKCNPDKENEDRLKSAYNLYERNGCQQYCEYGCAFANKSENFVN